MSESLEVGLQIAMVRANFTDENGKPTRHVEYKSSHPITSVEYDRLIANNKKIRNLEEIHFSSRILHWQYHRSLKDISKILSLEDYNFLHVSILTRLRVASELQKILEGFKIFIEMHQKSVDYNYTDTYKALKDDLFKNNFYYRFTQELRNFGQHNDFPISKITMNSVTSSDSKSRSSEVSIFINRDVLIKERPWGVHRSRLQSMPEEIDIIPIISKGFDELGRLHAKRMNDSELPKYQNNLIEILNDIDKYWDINHLPMIVKLSENENGGHNIRHYYFPTLFLLDIFERTDLYGIEKIKELDANFGEAIIPEGVKIQK